MITVGVDLAAEFKKTSVARIEWQSDRATVIELSSGHSDNGILDRANGADKVGIDAPFGWPDPFVDFVTAHRAFALQEPYGIDIAYRRRLANRATDVHVSDNCFGVRPLSVAADRIASVAMRCAGIQAQFGAKFGPVARSGTGLLVEVYPAAALQRWGFVSRKYKGSENTQSLRALVADLQNRAPWLELGHHAVRMAASDDEFDAVISALVARASCDAALIDSIPDGLRTAADVEGWIALPRPDSLEHLATPRTGA